MNQEFTDLTDIHARLQQLDGGSVAEAMWMTVCDFLLEEYLFRSFVMRPATDFSFPSPDQKKHFGFEFGHSQQLESDGGWDC